MRNTLFDEKIKPRVYLGGTCNGSTWRDEMIAYFSLKDIDYFNTAVDSIKSHEYNIINYFINRNTNASAESFNAKLKGFRSLVRGVRDLKFFMFRLAKLYG